MKLEDIDEILHRSEEIQFHTEEQMKKNSILRNILIPNISIKNTRFIVFPMWSRTTGSITYKKNSHTLQPHCCGVEKYIFYNTTAFIQYHFLKCIKLLKNVSDILVCVM